MAKGMKTGGRKEGTPNKITTAVRKAISDAVNGYYESDQFLQDIGELEPKDRVTAFEKLASYVVPKLQATTLDDKRKVTRTIEDKLLALSGGEDGK
mgnify:FL=1|jgi:hypothetical protein